MDERLIELRLHSIETSGKYLKAQSAYIEAACPSQKKSAGELEVLAEAVLAALIVYEDAILNILTHLRASELSAARDKEIAQMEVMYFIVKKEQSSYIDLISLHAS